MRRVAWVILLCAGSALAQTYPVRVSWPGDCTGTVSYGPTAAYGSTVAMERLGNTLSADIPAPPGTTFHWAYNICGVWSPDASVTMPPAGAACTQGWTGKYDIFGGAVMRCQFGKATGYFHTEKITFNGQTRWWIIDPAGNPIWIKGIQNAAYSYMSPAVLQQRYPNNVWDWYPDRNRRMRSWGFNTLGEFTAFNSNAFGAAGSVSGMSPPMVAFQNLSAARDSFGATGWNGPGCNIGTGSGGFGYLRQPVLDLLSSLSPNVLLPTWYRGRLVDAFSPDFEMCMRNEVAKFATSARGGATTGFTYESAPDASGRGKCAANPQACAAPWLAGITMDDADLFYGAKNQGTAPDSELVYARYPHIGLVAAVSSPSIPGLRTVNSHWAWCSGPESEGCTNRFTGGDQVTREIDPTNYTKRAWIEYLKRKYATIAELNLAWGTDGFYTQFESTGAWGTGTGVADEDGRNAWFGRRYGPTFSDRLFTLKGVNAALAADLNGFLYEYAKKWASLARQALNTFNPGMLLVAQDAIAACGQPVYEGIVKGLADGGVDILYLNYDAVGDDLPIGKGQPYRLDGVTPRTPTMANNKRVYDTAGKPVVMYYLLTAQRDSGVFGPLRPLLLGIADGTRKTFSAPSLTTSQTMICCNASGNRYAHTPMPYVEPRTTTIYAGEQRVVDDGTGKLAGAGASGTVDYGTTSVSVTFTHAPAAVSATISEVMPGTPGVVMTTASHAYQNGSAVNIAGASATGANGTFFIKTSGYAANEFGLYWDAALTIPAEVSGTYGGGGTAELAVAVSALMSPVFGPPGMNARTQATRGKLFARDVNTFLNAQGTNGDHYVIGLEFWQYFDHPLEASNQGLVSVLDNQYDGVETVTGATPCSPPMPPTAMCGGEPRNSGDMIGPVKSSLWDVYRSTLGPPQP